MDLKLLVLNQKSGLLKSFDLETITLNDVTVQLENTRWKSRRDVIIGDDRICTEAQKRYLGELHLLDEGEGIFIQVDF